MMKQFVGDPNHGDRLRNFMDPVHPIMSGVVQNQDSYMKSKIAQRYLYDRIPAITKRLMEEFRSLTGRRYGMIDAYGLDDAECAIVGMGSLVETTKATAKYLREKEGVKVATFHVTSFRRFPGAEIVDALKHLKAFAVIARMDNAPAQSNPLTVEIKAAFADALSGAPGTGADQPVHDLPGRVWRARLQFNPASQTGRRIPRLANFYLRYAQREKDPRALELDG